MSVWEILVFAGTATAFVFGLVALYRSGASPTSKLIWTLVILFLPLVGSLIYLSVSGLRTMNIDILDESSVNTRQHDDQDWERAHRPIG